METNFGYWMEKAKALQVEAESRGGLPVQVNDDERRNYEREGKKEGEFRFYPMVDLVIESGLPFMMIPGVLCRGEEKPNPADIIEYGFEILPDGRFGQIVLCSDGIFLNKEEEAEAVSDFKRVWFNKGVNIGG